MIVSAQCILKIEVTIFGTITSRQDLKIAKGMVEFVMLDSILLL